MRKINAIILSVLLSFGIMQVNAQDTLGFQSFENTTPNEWTYTATPTGYSEANETDVWIDTTSIETITAPSDGTLLWGIRDINNSGSGGDFYHTLDFPAIDLTGYTNVTLTFKYYTFGFEPNLDSLQYIIEYDNGSTWNSTPVNLNPDTQGWTLITVNIPDDTTYVRLRIQALQNGADDYAAIDEIALIGTPQTQNTYALPFIENFEDTVPATNWTAETTDATGDGWSKGDGTSYGPGSAVQGSYAAMANIYDMSSGSYATLTSPVIDMSATTNAKMTFFWQATTGSGAQPELAVDYSTDGGNTWNNVYDQEADGTVDNWTKISLTLQNVTATTQIRFVATSDYGYANLFVDSLVIEEPPAVPIISVSPATYSFPAIEENTTDSAWIFITNSGGADLIVSGTTVNAPFTCNYTGTIAIGETDSTLVYFAPTTANTYAETLTFNSNATQIENDTVALTGGAYPQGYATQDFEGGTFPPLGWDASAIWLLSQPGYNSANTAKASYSALSDTMKSPRLDISTGSNHFVEFYWKEFGSSNPDSVIVIFSDNGGSSWTQLGIVGGGNNSTWEKANFTIGAPASDNCYLAWVYVGNGSWDAWDTYIDEIIHPQIWQNPDPFMNLNTNYVNFGNVEVNNTATAKVAITNSGAADLTISGATVATPYACNYTGTIAAGATDTATITFAPTAHGFYIDTLTFAHNSASENDTVVIYGYAYPEGYAVQDFESADWAPNEGWTATVGWTQDASIGYNSTHSAKSNYANTSDTLTSPRLDLSTGTHSLSFYYVENGTGNPDSTIVEFTTDGGTTWNQLGVLYATNAYWDMGYYSLGSPASDNCYARWIYVGDGSFSTWNMYIDDVIHPPLYEAPVVQDSLDLVITEIMYNPPESGTDTLEYIEIYNNGSANIDMTNFAITDGVEFLFPAITLNAGEYVVICKDSTAMINAFGVQAYEWTSGGLNNSGELIIITTPDSLTIVDSVEYGDQNGWTSLAGADGDGYSLVLCDYNSDNKLESNWTLSANMRFIGSNPDTIYASPMAQDSACITTGIESDLQATTAVIYPNPTTGSINVVVNGNNENYIIEIVSLHGQLVERRAISNTNTIHTFDLSNVESGMYFVRVINNNSMTTQKVIVQ